MKLFLDYFLLIRSVKFFGVSLIFTMRIFNCFSVSLHMTTLTNCNQQHPITTQPTVPLDSSFHISSAKFPKSPM